jgi:segregation and condensation protein B
MSDEQEAIAEGQKQEGTDRQRIKALVESLLFVADEPARVDHLAQSLEVSAREVKEVLEELASEYRHRGLRLQFKDGRVQMVTAPEAAPVIERFLGLQLSSKLSPAALETLAIIAYRHPITRPQIDAIRGVNSDSVVRGLLAKGLIEEVGRLDQAGRPILYAPTFAFLQHFGLESLDQLPPLGEGTDKELQTEELGNAVQ